MIRWYDYVASICLSYSMLVAFFNLPVIGAVVAYGMWIGWGDYYCEYRKEMENNTWR